MSFHLYHKNPLVERHKSPLLYLTIFLCLEEILCRDSLPDVIFSPS
jgi:hypothetical protein